MVSRRLGVGFDQSLSPVWEQSHEAAGAALAGGTGSSVSQQLMLTSLPCERQMFIHSAFSVSGSHADVELLTVDGALI